MSEEAVVNGGAVDSGTATASATTTSAAPTSAAASSSGTASATASSSTTSAPATSSGTTASATSTTTSATTSAGDIVDFGKAISEAKLPDGFTIEPGAAKAASDIFAQHRGNPAELAKSLTEFYAGQLQAHAKGNADAWAKQVGDWKAASTADKELGAEAMGTAKTGLTKIFDTATMEVLERFGLTNHPGFLKGGLKIGKAIKDDTLVTGNAGGANGAADARKSFPNSDMNP